MDNPSLKPNLTEARGQCDAMVANRQRAIFIVAFNNRLNECITKATGHVAMSYRDVIIGASSAAKEQGEKIDRRSSLSDFPFLSFLI